jgi:hypothetical protein
LTTCLRKQIFLGACFRRLEDIDNSTTAGPGTPAARAALATSVVAHAVVELETQLIELKSQLTTK